MGELKDLEKKKAKLQQLKESEEEAILIAERLTARVKKLEKEIAEEEKKKKKKPSAKVESDSESEEKPV